ncbi:hypothetical protein CFK38_03855 [Brachybacterium vulturis]|uniref:N-acetyltransferase domain-containing protein n=1 Tax=Brachybacterium vulturis TaxID=2017484 RepID=A0A291GKJ7_9MICO|nr:hypothetical protein [Brachybacterium vulturis]ATG50751.1 hypothetical protein CFK38_03855 [Brachybacterium vulturis]
MGDPLLAVLDEARRSSGEEAPGPVVRERPADGSELRIVHSACPAVDLPAVIHRELELARELEAEFEWKLYGHDEPPGLAAALRAAGLEPEPREAVLALDLRALPATITERLEQVHEVSSVNVAGLADYERISIESGRKNAQLERARLAASLTAEPEGLQVHVAYRDGVPVSGGRLYLADHGMAELAGGRTVPAYRRRGYFTATVLSRISAAITAGAQTLWVDALPSSAPIFRTLGFAVVTWTEPYLLPGSADSE